MGFIDLPSKSTPYSNYYRQKGLNTGFAAANDQSCYYPAGIADANNSVATGVFTLVKNILYTIPFLTSNDGTINSSIFKVTTGGSADYRIRTGVYANIDGQIFPGPLIADFGEVSGIDVIGIKESIPNLTLPKNSLVWVTIIGNGTTNPVLRAFAPATGAIMNLHGWNADLTLECTYMSIAQAYGALPLTHPTGVARVMTLIPLVAFRFAS
jgi:hypothetical protein